MTFFNRKHLLLTSLLISSQLTMFAQAATMPDKTYSVAIESPAYKNNGLHVLIDSSHHNVHADNDGYSPFINLMVNDGYNITKSKNDFNLSLLNQYQILITANARGSGKHTPMPQRAKPAYGAAEVRSIAKWVEQGGSLLLILDHYPIGNAMDDLARQFDVIPSTGFAIDPENHYVYTGESKKGKPSAQKKSWLVYSRNNNLLKDHPITLGRNTKEKINNVTTFTGTSLLAPESYRSFLTLSKTSFDFMPLNQQRTPTKNHSQGLAFEYGKGRVVVLGEASMLTAQIRGPHRIPFGMNVSGNDNRQLTLNIMHWLSRLLP